MAVGVLYNGDLVGLPKVTWPSGTWTESDPTSGTTNPFTHRSYIDLDAGYVWVHPPFRRVSISDPLAMNNVSFVGNGSIIPNTFPSFYSAQIVIGNIMYWYGGYAGGYDPSLSLGDSMDRIHSAPLSNLRDVTLESNTLPVARQACIAVKNDSYVYVLGGTDGGAIHRAPLSDPTNFTSVGTQTFSSTHQIAAYQAESTVYIIQGTQGSTNSIYSSDYSDLETWVDTGHDFPGYHGRDTVLRIGDFFVSMGAGPAGGQESPNIYMASYHTPTKWYALQNAAPADFAGINTVVLDGFVWCYGGIISSAYYNKIWHMAAPGSVPSLGNPTCISRPGL